MHCRLAVLTSFVLLFACKSSTNSKPPAMSPEVAVSEDAVIVGGGSYPDQPVQRDGDEVAVGFDGTNYLVVWTQPGGVTLDDVYGARITPSGELIGSPFPISTAAGVQQTPAIAFDGQNWLVVFQDHRVGQYLNVYGARVRADGTVLDPGGIPIATQIDHQAHPAVAFDGANFLVVWADRRSGKWDVYGARVAPDGTVQDGDGIAVSAAPGHQIGPAIAFDGTNFLVAWQDLRSGDYDIYAARVSPAGAVLETDGIAVSAAGYEQSSAAVAFDGHDFVVAWQDLRGGVAFDVYAARVSPGGVVLDGSGVAVATAAGAQVAPAVAFDGAYALVVWEDPSLATSVVPASVYGARLDGSGTLLDPAAFLVADGTGGQSVAVASDGAGRALAAYDALDIATGAVRVRARVLTDWATLAVQKAGRGGGTVTSSPAGIDCGAACSSRFDAPTDVSLVATPDGDSVFGGWSGACAGTAACTVTVDGAKSATATFLPLYPLTVSFGSAVPGTVTSEPAGIQCGSVCSSRYVEGTAVRLTAKGVPGASVFSAWAGECGPGVMGAEAECAATMDGPKSVTATFVRAFTITLDPTGGTGSGTVTLSSTPCATGSTCNVDVAAGTTATITATPNAGSVFKSWVGCTPDAATPNVCTTWVSSAKTVTARFEPSTIPLTALMTGSGAGTVTGAGLACTTGSDAGCTAAVENPANSTSYSVVTLTATPSAGSVFKSWIGCTPDAVAPNVCTVTVSLARSVTARFEASTIPLTASTSGNGVGTVTGAGLACTSGSTAGCTAAVENPASSTAYVTVTIAATPSAGSVFKSWIGCTPDAVAPNVCTVTMNMARTVTARFETSTIPLTAITSGTGVGTVTGAGLACTTGSLAGCTAGVENPANSTAYTTVTLTATPSAGSVFKSWSGCTAVAGAPNVCTTVVNMERTVTAKFEPSTLPVTAVTSGTGVGIVTGAGLACTTGSLDGCTAGVENPANSTAYTTVTIIATPSAGSVFKSWMGCTEVPGTPNACTVTMSMARSVTAKFEPSTLPLTAVTTGAGGGTITGAGLACATGSTGGCVANVNNPGNTSAYETVTLTAAPRADSYFYGWSGCTPVPGTPNACTIAVNMERTVTARFELNTIPLTAVTIGTGAGTVTGAGLACTTGSPDGCTAAVANYSTVTLTATPSAGSVFKSWIGCTPDSGAPNVCTVTMSMPRSVTARFETSTIPLTAVMSGAGAGTVSGAGLACTTGSEEGCTAAVENPANSTAYTTVTLTATPSAGSVFKSWIGCTPDAVAPNVCTVTVSMARSVTARFEPSTLPLTATTSGTGGGTITGAGLACTTGSTDGCTTNVNNPGNTTAYETVTLTATPNADSVFKSWIGCTPVTGAPNVCTVPMNLARSVTAKFEPSTLPVTVTTSGTGAGTVTGAGLACITGSTEGCTAAVENPANVNAYTTVTLTAIPNAGSVFKSWSGCTPVADAPASCTLFVNTAKTVTATFLVQ